MKEVYKVVSKHSKNKDIQHKNSSSRFSLSFQKGHLALARNMSQCGGTGKMKDFWEKKVRIIVLKISDKGVVYNVKQRDECYIKI